MNRTLFIVLAVSFLFAVNVSAKSKVSPEANTAVATVATKSLSGMVVDKQTSESLAGAVITVNGQKVYSDLDGNFTLTNICDGKCEIKVSLISYQEKVIEVDTKKLKSLNITLSQR
ncbi:MAG: carboxypeptidase-like regulatory domain-containing protein [Paludibacteraceae bacterium]|nr:carboxypeptidase-like regulatory domain-containing protein [Paludibacteraceae bacterium]